jgi:hypothetical protein
MLNFRFNIFILSLALDMSSVIIDNYKRIMIESSTDDMIACQHFQLLLVLWQWAIVFSHKTDSGHHRFCVLLCGLY